MKQLLFIIIILVVSIGYTKNVYGTSVDEIIQEQFETAGLDEFVEKLKDISTENNYVEDISFIEIVEKLIYGELELNYTEMAERVFKDFIKEILSHIYIIRNIIFTVCICALAKNLSSSFQSRSVGEIGFYVCYILIIIILLQAFRQTVALTADYIYRISVLLDIFLPVLIGLLFASGSYMLAPMVYPLIIFIGKLMTSVLEGIIVPFIFSASTLDIINHINSEDILTNFSDLIKKGISFVLKGMCLLFTMAITLHKLTVPAIEGIVSKGAKVAISAVPVVGDIMTGTVETVMSWTGLIKNGVSIAAIIFLLILCMLPIMKLAVIIFIYSITAAIIQPIADIRIVKCIKSITQYSKLLLVTLFCSMFMFIISAIAGINMIGS